MPDYPNAHDIQRYRTINGANYCVAAVLVHSAACDSAAGTFVVSNSGKHAVQSSHRSFLRKRT